MNIIVNRIALLNALTTIETIVPIREIRPSIGNILFECKDNLLTISSTDMEMSFRNKLEVEIKKPGKITLPAKKISQTLKEMRYETVSITQSSDNKISIKPEEKNSRTEIIMMSSNIEDFPQVNFPNIDDYYSLDADLLLNMIRKTDYAMAENDARYVFNGLYMNFIENDLIVVATDGRRLSMCLKKQEEKFDMEEGIIIPHRSIREIKKILELTKVINIYYDKSDKKLFFNANYLDFLTRLIEGRYPDYNQVIPSSRKYEIKINKEEFVKILRLNAVLAAEPSRQVILKFSKKRLEMSASTPDVGDSKASLELPEYTGDDFKIGLNSKYLFDIIEMVQSNELIVELVSETSPMIIRDESDKNFKALIMPMRI